KHEEYLKDEKHFRNFLFNWAEKQLICTFGKKEMAEKDWSQFLVDATRYENALDHLCINFQLTNLQGHKLLRFLDKHPVIKESANQEILKNLVSFFKDYTVSIKQEEATEENPTPKTWFKFQILNKSWEVEKEFFTSEELPEVSKLFVPLKDAEEGWTMSVRDKNRTNDGKGIMQLIKGIQVASKPYLHLQRYKGLGEMNPEQLWETSMDNTTRSLLQVSIEDALEADSWFSTLMGDNVAGRKEFIEKNGRFARNLDV
ncbi:MAG: DNA gyrase subunit B, partial [Alteromonas naphthalenivorans]